ncbi:uncharacterized protein F5Z01DRAFT_639291 [Emericellopsis atlantica]|uniref:Uncharacterized protein n=1 Tax=Emericellopsis atlantica TaxID=2614577 RepID=A0A9P7ZGQ1_9HYPO|nr:uncharacterized protein F5Z01DRAFT_639291 [Emericellopsis atlantica]KAG9251391.1 hypothetical protein F5Z01DRAFT_639291 [Emericellopsis atlantica]
MAPNKRMTTVTAADVFPALYMYLFLIIEPGIIWIALPLILVDPSHHFHSLAPAGLTSGPYFTTSPASPPASFLQAWHTPQTRELLYLYVAAMAFSAVVEPMLLYLARYKLHDARDTELVVTGVLLSFLAFDVFHAAANWAVVGSASLTRDMYAAINFWIPVGLVVIRSMWLLGVGRSVTHCKTD